MLALTDKKEIIHIKDALSKTDYYCAKCGGRLRVREGKIRVKHFYHLGIDCGSKGESLVHKYWKNYFLNLKEFEGYKIIDSRKEFSLFGGTYIPDVILKTDKNTYIIIEIFYTNSKDSSYLEKFERFKRLEKAYEVKVDVEKIISIKELYDKEEAQKMKRKKEELIREIKKKKEILKNEIEKKKEYLLSKYYKNGGLLYKILEYGCALKTYFKKDIPPKYEFYYDSLTWERSRYSVSPYLRRKRFKVYLEEKKDEMVVKSTPFEIYIYDYEEMCNNPLVKESKFIRFYSEDENLKGDISIVIEDELESKK